MSGSWAADRQEERKALGERRVHGEAEKCGEREKVKQSGGVWVTEYADRVGCTEQYTDIETEHCRTLAGRAYALGV